MCYIFIFLYWYFLYIDNFCSQVGERIRVILDCDDNTLSFEKNYEFLGVAFRGMIFHLLFYIFDILLFIIISVQNLRQLFSFSIFHIVF